MAIIICSDCNKEMSDSAPACPHCGKPNTTTASRSVGLLLGIGILFLPMLFSWFTLRKGHSTKSRVISFCWLVFSLLIVVSGNKPPDAQKIASNPSAVKVEIKPEPVQEEARKKESLLDKAQSAVTDIGMDGLYTKVINDSIDQYNITKRGGNAIEICVQAGMVSAAFLQAKDEAGYKKWKDIEKKDCKKAGM